MGTVAYMPPEQAAGSVEEVDRRSDVFGLGAILCTVLTGQPPHRGPSEDVVLRQALSGDLSDAERRLSECAADEELVSLTRKCLARSREDRPADAGAVARAIGRYLAGVEERRQLAEIQRAQAEVKASEEQKRHLVERQKRRMAVGLATASLLLTLLLAAGGGACLWYWDAHLRVKVQHYAGVANRFGVKEGVGPLSAAEARRRGVSYRVYRRGGLVERVDVVNGLGELTAAPDDNLALTRSQGVNGQSSTVRECRFEYIRNQQGELVEERAFDRNGGLAWALHYTTPTTAHFVVSRRSGGAPLDWPGPSVNSNPTAESRLGPHPEGLPQARTLSGVRYLRFTWTEQGFVKEVRYIDVNGRPLPDDGRVCGVRPEHDARGLVVRATFLDAKGLPALHAVEKFNTLVMERDERGEGPSGPTSARTNGPVRARTATTSPSRSTTNAAT
jgi:hypothetical protein